MGETWRDKGETWWRPGRDRFLGLDSSSIEFYVQKYLLMPIFKTRRPVSPSQIGAQRSQRSGTKSAREFELLLGQPLCWPMQNQGVLIYCRENMSAPSHVHFNTFFCTVSTFVLWTIWILARFLWVSLTPIFPNFLWCKYQENFREYLSKGVESNGKKKSQKPVAPRSLRGLSLGLSVSAFPFGPFYPT